MRRFADHPAAAMNSDDTHDRTIAESDHGEEIATLSLVLSAVDISHSVISRDHRFLLCVAADDQQRALYHIERFREENEGWPPEAVVTEEVASSLRFPALLVIGALMLFYFVTGPWNRHSLWFIEGAGDSTLILGQGEYFRLITALTLHADLTHLLGNCLFGAILLHFFFRTIGPGMGIFALVLAAGLGNYLNVILHGEGHRFVGFSTAVFAAIGMQVMVGYHASRKQSKLQIAAPFMAGAALLAMTGSGGVRTDLGAHLLGMLSGFVLGGLLISPLFLKLRHSSFLQTLLFICAWVAVTFSWHSALQTVH